MFTISPDRSRSSSLDPICLVGQPTALGLDGDLPYPPVNLLQKTETLYLKRQARKRRCFRSSLLADNRKQSTRSTTANSFLGTPNKSESLNVRLRFRIRKGLVLLSTTMIEYTVLILPLNRFSMLRSKSLEKRGVSAGSWKRKTRTYFTDLFPFCWPCSFQFTDFFGANKQIQTLYEFTRQECTTFRTRNKDSLITFQSVIDVKEEECFFLLLPF
jgi:hypothetical protein